MDAVIVAITLATAVALLCTGLAMHRAPLLFFSSVFFLLLGLFSISEGINGTRSTFTDAFGLTFVILSLFCFLTPIVGGRS